MTNTIEQMYKEYGVENKNACMDCIYCPYDIDSDNCKKKKQVEFTAEKQIRLIFLIITAYKNFSLHIEKHEALKWFVYYSIFDKVQITVSSTFDYLDFENELAEFVIKLKPYIDNSKVKEILEK